MRGLPWELGEPCWWCDQTQVPVLWLGEAREVSDVVSAPVYACLGCLDRLAARIRAHTSQARPPRGRQAVMPLHSRAAWSVPPAGLLWATGEPCWWCDRMQVPVARIGEARVIDGGDWAPVHACARCGGRLSARIRAYAAARYRRVPRTS